ncbi:MAG: EboA domain-containing protein [Actinomadura sp.]
MIQEVLSARLTTDAARWLNTAMDRVGGAAEALRPLFPAVGRHCGRALLDTTDPDTTDPDTTDPDATDPGTALHGWTVDDAARALLLTRLPLTGRRLADEVADLYRYGDAAEKRGVLRGLALLDVGDAALPVVHDALRTNDTRLVAAALGPYGAARLAAPAYRQAVLKCVFMGVPLADIAGLPERRDAELARMLGDFARERVAAGRPVPADVWLVTDPEAIDPEEN